MLSEVFKRLKTQQVVLGSIYIITRQKWKYSELMFSTSPSPISRFEGPADSL